jgi:hypothetical protein
LVTSFYVIFLQKLEGWGVLVDGGKGEIGLNVGVLQRIEVSRVVLGAWKF